MGDIFSSPTFRVEQPRKVVQTQTRYDFFDDSGTPLAVATDVAVRSRRDAMRAVLPQGMPGAPTVVVKDVTDVPLLVLVKKNAWLTSVRRPPSEGTDRDDAEPDPGELIGELRGNSTRRLYELVDAEGNKVGDLVGDLKLRRFRVVDNEQRKVAQVVKKWAGLRTELFTNADRYDVEITGRVGDTLRILIVVSAIVLDLTAHEAKYIM